MISPVQWPTNNDPADDWGEQKRADANLERQAGLGVEINKNPPDLCDLILVDGGPA